MKRFLLLSICLCSILMLQAQISKTLNLATEGTLSNTLTATEKTTITNLIITGNIDARDVKCMRDELSAIETIDMSGVSIRAYTGTEGTDYLESTYPADEMPKSSFYIYEIGKISLKTFQLPNSVKSIGMNAFYGCSNLHTINFQNPNSLYKVGQGALKNTMWLNNQPDGIIYLGNVLYTYKGTMPTNSKFEIEEGILGIADRAFSSYRELVSIDFPSTLKHIGESAFSNCEGILILNIPNSVKTIGDAAFGGCTNVEIISIPKSVVSIGNSAFWKLYRLKSIFLYVHNPINIEYNMFEKTDKAFCTLYIPKGTKTKYLQSRGWNYFINIVEFDATALNAPTLKDFEINYNSVFKSISVKGIDKPFSIAIYNINGEMCNLNELNEPNQDLYIGSLTQGIYIVKVTVNNEVISRKIQVF